MKNKGSAEKEREDERPPQQWKLDYALTPFDGLTPEYMEMSESAWMHARTHACTHAMSSHLGANIHLK